jgi:hypothetical protein
MSSALSRSAQIDGLRKRRELQDEMARLCLRIGHGPVDIDEHPEWSKLGHFLGDDACCVFCGVPLPNGSHFYEATPTMSPQQQEIFLEMVAQKLKNLREVFETRPRVRGFNRSRIEILSYEFEERPIFQA